MATTNTTECTAFASVVMLISSLRGREINRCRFERETTFDFVDLINYNTFDDNQPLYLNTNGQEQHARVMLIHFWFVCFSICRLSSSKLR